MMQFIGHFMKLPVELFVYSMEMLVATMQGIQNMSFQGFDSMADGLLQTPNNISSHKHYAPRFDVLRYGGGLTPEVVDSATGDRAATMRESIHKEERRMPDRDLGGDDLKLVRYKVLFVRRDYEYAFQEQEELVYDNTDGAAFTAWKVAEFIQSLDKDKYKFPEKWEDTELDNPKYKRGNYLKSLPEEDKKYLRVFFEVLDRYPREPLRYEEEQLRILRDIASNLKSDGGTNAPAGSGPGTRGSGSTTTS